MEGIEVHIELMGICDRQKIRRLNIMAILVLQYQLSLLDESDPLRTFFKCRSTASFLENVLPQW